MERVQPAFQHCRDSLCKLIIPLLVGPFHQDNLICQKTVGEKEEEEKKRKKTGMLTHGIGPHL